MELDCSSGVSHSTAYIHRLNSMSKWLHSLWTGILSCTRPENCYGTLFHPIYPMAWSTTHGFLEQHTFFDRTPHKTLNNCDGFSSLLVSQVKSVIGNGKDKFCLRGVKSEHFSPFRSIQELGLPVNAENGWNLFRVISQMSMFTHCLQIFKNWMCFLLTWIVIPLTYWGQESTQDSIATRWNKYTSHTKRESLAKSLPPLPQPHMIWAWWAFLPQVLKIA